MLEGDGALGAADADEEKSMMDSHEDDRPHVIWVESRLVDPDEDLAQHSTSITTTTLENLDEPLKEPLNAHPKVIEAITLSLISDIVVLDLANCDLKYGHALKSLCNVCTQCPSLNKVDLSCNKLGDAGAKLFMTEVFANGMNSNISDLNLSFNSIGPEGGFFVGESLVNDRTLTTLNLNNNSIGLSGAEALAKAITEPTSCLSQLFLAMNSIPGEGAAELASAFRSNPHPLKILFIPGNPFEDGGVSAIAFSLAQVGSSCRVKAIDFSATNIGDSAAMAIGNMVSKLMWLETLFAFKNKITDEGVACIAEGLSSIARDSSLTTLKLSDNLISDAGVQNLTKSFQHLKTLTNLNLCGNKIGDVGAESIAEYVKGNGTLQELNLASNAIGDRGGSAIGRSLGHNRKLENLFLGENFLDNGFCDGLAEGLISNRTLRYLRVNDNYIGDEGIEILCTKSLVENNTLRIFHLQQNKIGDKGLVALGHMLKENVGLQILNLANNLLSDDHGCDVLLEALEFNVTIVEIILSGNKMSKEMESKIQRTLQQTNSAFSPRTERAVRKEENSSCFVS
eukprot:TRINITY_DN7107_c0_g1_i2.p1 TRINITY_DN7107_c0_g1~~TRINITY_DN7107_c0_g1_i2.p1  ORF type:complete len:568 (+),score=141.95 TRINITY_DN7107_c0_g1_i2:151-1854(+)